MFWHSGGLGRVQEVTGGGSWRCGVRMARWFPCSRAPNDGEPPKSIFLANASGHHFCTYPSYTGVPRGFLCRMFFLFFWSFVLFPGNPNFLYLQNGTCIGYRALTQKQKKNARKLFRFICRVNQGLSNALFGLSGGWCLAAMWACPMHGRVLEWFHHMQQAEGRCTCTLELLQ